MSFASDVAFTSAVKAVQARKGSRRAYARLEQAPGWETRITPDLKRFIDAQISAFFATASADGQPYVQHRGGPPGFLNVIDDHTIAFVDFAGNRQYISQGNLSENPKAQLFLIDYAHATRIKIWGTAKVIETDEKLIATLMPKDYRARPEQVVVFTVAAWDANCPQHIPQRFEAADVEAVLAEKDRKILQLENEIRRLKVGRHA